MFPSISRLDKLSCKSRDSWLKQDVRGRSVPLLPKVWLFKARRCLHVVLVPWSVHVWRRGSPHCAGEDVTMGGTNFPSTCDFPPGELVWVVWRLKSPFWLQVDNYPESCNEAAARKGTAWSFQGWKGLGSAWLKRHIKQGKCFGVTAAPLCRIPVSAITIPGVAKHCLHLKSVTFCFYYFQGFIFFPSSLEERLPPRVSVINRE